MLLDFVLLMAAVEDAHSPGAIRVPATVSFVLRELVCEKPCHSLFNSDLIIQNVCTSHGGGKRCKVEGCSKSAVGGSHFCTSHGGGKRCMVEGCDKSAQSSTSFCVKHGGGKKCQFQGCEKVARGKTLYCAAVSYLMAVLVSLSVQ